MLKSASIKPARPFRTLAILGASAVVWHVATPELRAQDPRIGSWTLVSAQSELTPPNKLTVTDVQGTVHVVMSGESHFDFTAKADGQDTPVTGNPGFNQVQIRRVGKRETEATEKKNGKLVDTVRVTASSNGTELIAETAAPGRPTEIAVWSRTGGARAAHDPLAGDWVEDLSKSRLRQGLLLKFEPDGTGGVRFSGDFSYTARLDGRPYDLRDSRNDTVALQLVDPHTVDAVYRRDGQVTQHDRWVVSPDGHQLTVTTTASLETGQRLAEKLIFKKQ